MVADKYRPLNAVDLDDFDDASSSSSLDDLDLRYEAEPEQGRRCWQRCAGSPQQRAGWCVLGALALVIFAMASSLKVASRKKQELVSYYGVLNRTEVPIVPLRPQPSKEDEEYVALCLAVKGQVFDLPEWLRHHYYHIGIRHFYIMDDGTSPPLRDQLTDFELGVPRSAVHFHYYDSNNRSTIAPQQIHAYSECVRVSQDRHTWMAFIDGDELFEMTDPTVTIQSLLREHEGTAGGVGVNWLMHNSNDLLHKPPRGAMRSTFTECLIDPTPERREPIDNGHIKLIAQTKYFGGMITPHHGRTGDLPTVDELGEPIPAPGYLRIPPSRTKITLHHYVVKSQEEYKEKVSRGNGMGDPKAWDFWDYVAMQEHAPCTSLQNYYP